MFNCDLFKKRLYRLSLYLASTKRCIVRSFKNELGYKPNLKHPKTFCEKLQWLKLHDHKAFYTDMADKYKAKFIAESYGLKTIPLLGVYDHFRDIDFNKLPQKFVLKTNHYSGDIIICEDKARFDYNAAKRKMEHCLRTNYYRFGREWPYKNIKRKIIVESFIDGLGTRDSTEYKVTCFNGRVEFITVCHGKAHSDFSLRKNDFYDSNFKMLPFITDRYGHYEGENKKPSYFDEMLRISEQIAKDTIHLRIDYYDIKGELYFGEITFFSRNGFIKFVPSEFDSILGKKLVLPID